MDQCFTLVKAALPFVYTIVDLDIVKDQFPILRGFEMTKDFLPTMNTYADRVFGGYKYHVLSSSFLVAGGGCYLAYRKYYSYIDTKRKLYPKDVVILHQLDRAPCAPSMSPECMKLETFLRIAKIPYQNEFGLLSSAKFKMPWITYNNEDISDTQTCIEFLNRKFSVNLNKNLTARDVAISTAFRLCIETDLYFLMTYQMWYTDECNMALEKMMGLRIRYVLRYTIFTQAKMNGHGARTQKQREQYGRNILEAIETLIGDKKYTMGDEVTELDAVVFGYISMAMFHLFDSEYQRCILEDLPNLCGFIETMKEEFYDDWESIIVGLE